MKKFNLRHPPALLVLLGVVVVIILVIILFRSQHLGPAKHRSGATLIHSVASRHYPIGSRPLR